MKYTALLLVLITVVVFILQNTLPITEAFALVSTDVLNRPWTILTHMFLHGDFGHLFYNMFALGLFGFILENIIGSKKFLILYFVSGFVAALGSIFFYEAVIGASGAIFGILGGLGVLRPRMTVYVGYIPMPMALAVILWAGGNMLGLFYPTQVAYIAHLAGLAFGLVFGMYLRGEYGEKIKRRKREEIDEDVFREWEERYMK